MTSQKHIDRSGIRHGNGITGRFADAVTYRYAKWIILAIWIGIMAIASPFAAQLPDVENNETAEWLPADAESLQVHLLQQEMDDGDVIPAVVVFHREDGLTSQDLEHAESNRQTLAAKYPDLDLSPLIPSEDGNALMLVVPLREAEDEFFYELPEIRELVSQQDGLQVQVTGPAGFFVDSVEVFDGIEATLLIVSASVVAVLLLAIYRSPVLWMVPLLVVGFAHQTSSAMIYGFVERFGMTANSQNTGLLPILVFGVGTDYALLLIARYREELRRHLDKHVAMGNALRRSGPAILASAATTIIGLLMLLFADLNATRGLGPIGAAGIFSAFLAMITLLPAVLLIFGRRIFWPFVPEYGSDDGKPNGIWASIGQFVGNRPRPIWAATIVLLAVLAAGFIGTETHLPYEDAFRSEPESVTGQRLLSASFPAGAGAPATVLAESSAAGAVEEAIAATSGVAAVEQRGAVDDLVAFSVTIDAEPNSREAFQAIENLRESVHAVPSANAMVGGQDAMDLDVADANARDRMVIIPLVFVVVMAILILLLRSLVAPLIMVGTSILSYVAALGGSVLVFEHVLGHAALDDQVILLSFVFLVTLGIDYNIFLMGRVREESERQGTQAGMLSGLAVTGGVITSAGIVLAATFAVLWTFPLIGMVQLGFVVAFGLLLETMIVRSILLPALTISLGDRVWWPGSISPAVRKSGTVIGVALVSALTLAACGLDAQSNVGEHRFDNPLNIPPLLAPETDEQGRKVFDLTFVEGESEIIPGTTTRTWGLNGPHLSPTVRAERGDEVVLNVRNELSETTTLHWHGMHLPARMDGGPHQMIDPGETWSPTWTIDQPAATLWFHPHLHGATAEHVYRGAAGMFIIDDPESSSLSIPGNYGIDDIPLIVQDKQFQSDGSLDFSNRPMSNLGILGDEILVNGTLAPVFEAMTSLVRFRILNASNARIYNFEFDDRRSFAVIGTDTGLLEAPVQVRELQLSPGERAEIVVEVAPNDDVMLRSSPPDLGVDPWTSRTSGGGDNFDILRVTSSPQLSNSAPLPDSLVTIERLSEVDAVTTRTFSLESTSRINGEPMDMARIDEVVLVNTTEVWEISNNSGAVHNFHIHLIHFQVLDIDGSPPPAHFRGWKDTVFVPRGSTVRIIAEFRDYADPNVPYMYHCHILQHEDSGMMGQFIVVEPGMAIPDAIESDASHDDH